MRVVIQRVKDASCYVDNELISHIDKGLLLLVGFCTDDDDSLDLDKIAKKIVNMRIFADEFDKMNLSVKDVNGQILAISQFTLYADIRKGNRPSFTNAQNFNKSLDLYESFVIKLNKDVKTFKGKFGALMQISFTNDGPVTIILDSKDILEG